MKYTAEQAWEMTIKNRHSENPKDYINEAIFQATREGKAWCTVMISYEDYKTVLKELIDRDYEVNYKAGMLTVSWFDGGASKMY